MRRFIEAIGVLALALALLPTVADAAQRSAGEATVTLPSGGEALADQVIVRYRGAERERVVELDDADGVRESLRELRDDPRVRWAAPDAIAEASRIPRDRGVQGRSRGGWQGDQWNFLAPPPEGQRCTPGQPCGVNAPLAWDLLRRSGHPEGRRRNGKRGPIVAVVDTGVAYRRKGRRFRRSPELARGAFVRGRDFVGHNEHQPLDRNGHGTHVTSTIIQRTGNRGSVTGLADGLRLMPVRVLGADGSGAASDVAKGVRWAARHGARVINLSLEFAPGFRGCNSLRSVCQAIAFAERKGAIVVAAAGNAGAQRAQMPGRVAFGVASGTIRGCLSQFSSRGPGVAITAPGGGADSGRGAGSQCRNGARGPSIVQLTLRDAAASGGNYRRFGYPVYEGTSMAAPHVSAAAALVVATKVLGRRPEPEEVERRLQCTARPPFDPAHADLYGAGLLDLAAALDPSASCR